MLLERLFYYRGEAPGGWRAFLRNGYMLAALALWASGVVFALESAYPLTVEAYLLTAWMAPIALYWTPLFQRGVMDRLLLTAPGEAGLPARMFGFVLLLVPIAGTLLLAVAAGSYVVSRQRGRVGDIRRTAAAVREREAELLDEIAAMDATGAQAEARDYLHAVVEELHGAALHPADTAYRKRLLADIEANLNAVREAGTAAETG